MSDFARDLANELSAKLGGDLNWKENPLAVFGISQTILGLGLDNDGLFNLCKHVARTVLIALHPDKKAPVSKEMRHRLSQAHALLNNRKHFDKAVDELRHQRSVLLSEINVEKEVNRALREQLNIAKGDLGSLKTNAEAYLGASTFWRQKLAGFLDVASDRTVHRTALPSLFASDNVVYNIEEVTELLVVNTSFVSADHLPFSHKYFASLRNKYEDLERAKMRFKKVGDVIVEAMQEMLLSEEQLQQKKQATREDKDDEWVALREKFYRTGMGTKTPKDLFAKALDSREFFPPVELDDLSFLRDMGLEELCLDNLEDVEEPYYPAEMKQKDMRSLNHKYRALLTVLQQLLEGTMEFVSRASVRLELMSVHSGIVQSGSLAGSQIRGCVPLEALSPGSMTITEFNHKPAFLPEVLLTGIEPLLIPYSFMVLTPHRKPSAFLRQKGKTILNFRSEVFCPRYIPLTVTGVKK